MENCLTFSSAEPFTIGVANATKNWDGTLYYSTDKETWSEWDGTTAIASAEHEEEQRIYMCGLGNSGICYIDSEDYKWVLTGSDIYCNGNIENLLDYTLVANGRHPTMRDGCYSHLFNGCTSLVTAPELPATTLVDNCYHYMFCGCTSLVTLPELPATTLADNCYYAMFYNCTSIMLSKTQTDVYTNMYRIPIRGTGTTASNSLSYMFGNTGGTFTGTPEINTTYYTANAVA